MKRLLSMISLLFLCNVMFAQYVYTINADSVKITNHCDTAELILENHTQTVPGFLFNKGRGRTEFRRALVPLNDSLYLLGADTLNTRKGLSGPTQANNGLSTSGGVIVLGNNTGDTTARLLSNRVIPMNGSTLSLNGTAGNQTILSGGGLSLQEAITTATSFGGIVNMNGSMDFANSTPNQTLSTGTTNFLVNYTLHGTSSSANITSTSVAIQDAFTPTGIGNFSYTGLNVSPYYDFSNYAAISNQFYNYNYRSVRGIYYNGFVNGTVPARHIAYENTNGDNIFNSGAWGNTNMGKSGFQGVNVPTAYVHIGAGTAAAASAPLKFTAGTLLTTPETGAVEYDGANYYGTVSTTRYTLAKTITATATLDFPGTAAQNSADLTITLAGAAVGDVVALGPAAGSVSANSCFTAWVSAANTVSVRFNNYSSGTLDPASGVFRVSVIKY